MDILAKHWGFSGACSLFEHVSPSRNNVLKHRLVSCEKGNMKRRGGNNNHGNLKPYHGDRPGPVLGLVEVLQDAFRYPRCPGPDVRVDVLTRADNA